MIAEEDTPGRDGIYVPMTRGRNTNRAVVATGTPSPDASDAADIITEALGRRWIDSPAIGEMAETPAEQRAAARAALEHVTAMAKRNRATLRRRSHPLHFARKQRLTDQLSELFDVSTERETEPAPMDARAEALGRIRRARAQYNLPDSHEPDIGI